jgi:hypothetical protein
MSKRRIAEKKCFFSLFRLRGRAGVGALPHNECWSLREDFHHPPRDRAP